MLRHRLLSASNNLLLVCTLILSTGTANAVVNSTQSRLVFNEDSMSESLTVVNSVSAPALVQIWADDDDPLSPPDRINTPLIIVPPLFKLAPAESRNLKVMLLSREKIPKDRERVYWLNIYQIPPNTQQHNAQGKQMILPLRIRLKVFIRPVGLKAPEENIGEKLRFTHSKTDAENTALTIGNPTPYYITIGSLNLGNKGLSARMMAPFSSTTITVENAGSNPELSWTVIDDYGKQTSYQRELSSP